MKFTTILSIPMIAIIGSTSALIISTSAPNGFSLNIVDGDGKETHLSGAQLTPAVIEDVFGPGYFSPDSATSTTMREKRGTGTPKCADFEVDGVQVKVGAWGFADWFGCGQDLKNNGSHISATYKQGAVVFYACDYGSKGQRYTRDQLLADYDLIQGKCQQRGGWVSHDEWGSAYGYTQPGVSFC